MYLTQLHFSYVAYLLYRRLAITIVTERFSNCAMMVGHFLAAKGA